VVDDKDLVARELEHHLDALLLDEGDEVLVVFATVVGELTLVLSTQLAGHQVPGVGEVALDGQAVHSCVVAKELLGDIADLGLRGCRVLPQSPDERRATVGVDVERERTEQGEVESVSSADESNESPDARADGQPSKEAVDERSRSTAADHCVTASLG